MDPKFIKSKDFVTFLKSKIYVLFNQLLMRGNMSLYAQIQFMRQQQNALPGKQPASAVIKGEHELAGGLQMEEADRAGSLAPNLSYVTSNVHWINQIQMYNILKFKNQGFKFWIEWPTAWGNNFLVVKHVTRRRNWLTWVDYDPYEERAAILLPEPSDRRAIETSPKPAGAGKEQAPQQPQPNQKQSDLA
jgi:hypothetical protein